MDWAWVAILVFVLVLEGWLYVAKRGTLTERVRRSRYQLVLRLSYLALVAALYAHFFHGWLG